MSKIKLLSENIILKIAAGEVVERPASVVKELVENSIDAGAHTIWVETIGGGKQSITVVDDGQGMSEADARLSVQRHATSKMSSPSDLFTISTLGFRGEALASIGAVSRMSIETRTNNTSEGSRLLVDGGVITDVLTMGRARGTTVKVRNLFFNTPARRKFLRHNDTEVRHISQTISQLAAAYPDVSFDLFHQDRNIYQLKRGGRIDRGQDLLGITEPIELRMEEDGISLEGVICNPSQCGKSKNKQYIIVRGRPIVSSVLTQAIYRGFGGLLPQKSHPVYIIWFDLDPRLIDVNVHPTKREIRFAEELKVVHVLEKSIRKALDISESIAFTNFSTEATFIRPLIGEERVEFNTGVKNNEDAGNVLNIHEVSNFGIETSAQSELTFAAPKAVDDSGRKAISGFKKGGSGRFWQVKGQYILLDTEDGIAIVDQQAAHERVRYEEALISLEGASSESQQLLIPINISLSRVEMEVAREHADQFKNLGFNIKEFGGNTLIIDAVPAALGNWDSGRIFHEIINDLIENKIGDIKKIQENLARSYAKRTCIRKGQILNLKETEFLIDSLLNTKEPFLTSDGKKTILKISTNELGKMFD